MILIDTSIWIDHLRQADTSVAQFLRNRLVLIHPYVVGEIALGNFARRKETLYNLGRLPTARVAKHDDVLRLIESEPLFGSGIGYVDAHLLASTKLTPAASLWTRDRRLKAAAEKMNVAMAIN